MSAPTESLVPPLVRVFYNSACPICDAGIKYLQTKTRDANVSYEDVHLDHTLLAQLNVPIDVVRERLHVIDEHQQLQVGIDAFITIWRHSERGQWKARFFSTPVIHLVSSWLYNALARCLYRWNRSKNRW